MLFEFNKYSALLLIGVVHGLIYAGLMIYRGKKEDRKADLLMAGVLLTLTLYVSQWMLGFAGWYDAHNGYSIFMFYVNFTLPFLLGPLFYCYFLALTNNQFSFRSQWKHFIPAIIYFAGDIFIAVYDLLINNFIMGNGLPYYEGSRGPIQEALNNESFWWLEIINQLARIHVIVYLVMTILTFRKYKKYLVRNFSNTENLSFTWFNSIILLLGISMTAFLLMNYIADIFGISYVNAWYFYFVVSVSIFVLGIQSYRQPIRELSLLEFQPSKAPAIEQEIIAQEKTAEFDVLRKQLELAMATKRPYLDPELTVGKLATLLNTNSNYLSKVINSQYQQHFNDFINSHRIQRFVERLSEGDHREFTLLSLALDCGFNSKATFNRAFKKHKGTSPAAFAKQLNLIKP